MNVEPVAISGVDADVVADALLELLDVTSVADRDHASIDPAPFLQIHSILRDRFPLVHESLEVQPINELSLLYRWPGQDPSLSPILLMSHIDVVPIDSDSIDQWTDKEAKARIDQGYVWGRGALDVKCGVVAILSAAEHLLDRGYVPKRTVYIALGHDEEVGGRNGNGVIAKQFRDSGTRLHFVVDEGGAILNGIIPGIEAPVAFVAIAEKQFVELTITARGEGGHGSIPGQSAIVNLAECIGRIHRQPMPARMTDATATLFDFAGPEMPWFQRTIVANRKIFEPLLIHQFSQQPSTDAVIRTTLNVTQISSSSHSNQSATEAHATINARLLPGQSAETAREHIREITKDIQTYDQASEQLVRAIDCTIGYGSHGELVSPTDCDQFQLLQKTIHQIFPDVKVAAGLTSVSTDSAWYFPVCDHVYRFIPMRVGASDVARIHGIDERIGIENLGEIVRFYVQLLRNVDSSVAEGQATGQDQHD